MTNIYYLLLLILTAVGASFATLHVNKLKRVIKRLFTFKRKVKHNIDVNEFHALQCIRNMETKEKLDDLQTQIDNIAGTIAMREHNFTNKVNRQIDKKLKAIVSEK